MKTSHDIFTNAQILELFTIAKIGTWIWYLETGEVYYSKEWCEITGYEIDELKPTISTWDSMLHPDDSEDVGKIIEEYIDGKNEYYVADFRMIRKDGSIIWAQDKGRAIAYDDEGKPTVLSGIMQDITKLKEAEIFLKERSELLDIIINISGFGTWDWDYVNNKISYNAEYMELIGYPGEDFSASIGEFQNIAHPDDIEPLSKMLFDYIEGKIDHFECLVRLRHKDGHYVWTRDIGRITERDKEGKPTRLVGGHLNIDGLVRAQEELAKHQSQLEEQIKERTKSLLEHEKMLLAVNTISQNLLTIPSYTELDEEIFRCLHLLEEVYNNTTFSLWRNTEVEGKIFCHAAYQLRADASFTKERVMKALEVFDVTKVSNNTFNLSQKEEFFETFFADAHVDTSIDFMQFFPSWLNAIQQDKSLNSSSAEILLSERFLLHLMNIKCVLSAPIMLENRAWGFMNIMSSTQDKAFGELEENMLRLCGSLFANAIKKAEKDEELRLAHEDALISSQAKTNFLANMSHEIRTPMNAISGMAEILLRKSTEAEITEYASGIKAASASLLTIINDILDISKIESGKLDISESEYLLPSLVNDTLNVARMRLENKNLLFAVYIDSTLPSKYVGDEIRIKQILINLLNNAIKFTPSGHISLRITGKQEGDKFYLSFAVKDTGMGIKEEDMQKLFEEFERVNTTKNRNIEGTGLGLAISKKLCEMMEGSITAESVYEQGSTFTMQIPQKVISSSPFAKVEKAKNILLYESRPPYSSTIKESIENLGSTCSICLNQSEFYEMITSQNFDYLFVPSLHLPKAKKLIEREGIDIRIVLLSEGNYTKLSDDDIYTVYLPATCLQIANALNNVTSSFELDLKSLNFIAPAAHILLVDDNLVNLKVASELMRPYQFNITTAINGLEAVKKVKEEQFDLVFMDHMMPEMDGIDATIEIRKMQGDYFKNLPIIALTANAIAGTKSLFTEEGMDDFLAKPIEINKLNEVLLNWLPKEKIKMVDIENSNTELGINKEEDNSIDFPLEIKDIDIQYGLRALGGNKENYLDILDTYYTDGLKKIALIQNYYTMKDLSAFKIEVHAIKSASASIGALALSKLAADLEHAAINEDWITIDKHTDTFLEDFHTILESLHTVLQTLEPKEEVKTKGTDLAYLHTKLEELKEAIDFVDIAQIESILKEVSAFDYGDEITQLFSKIKESISHYEYDEALPIIEEINKLSS